jgi:BlaI family transcriptional regulator, penicillinase repressor
MKRLSEKEEAIMRAIWQMEKAFAREVREALAEPLPHISTVNTMMRRLVDKGFLAYEDFGSTHRYTPAISQKEYNNKVVKPLLKGLFGDSLKNAVAFFVREEEISPADLQEIIKMIEKEK